jgi:peroxiredoxin
MNLHDSLCGSENGESGFARRRFLLIAATTLFCCLVPLRAQDQRIVWTDQERPIANQINGLRKLPDDVRAQKTKQLAVEIRRLPASKNKVQLAYDLSNLSTEGDLGSETLQEVTTTLASALRETPVPSKQNEPAMPYFELARLVRYEHMQSSFKDPRFSAAMSKLEADDARRRQANFTLEDLHGTRWTLRGLAGKVVIVNFWATWCPPCRKEMPDLDALYQKFKDQGFVVLAISDEDAGKVKTFIAQEKVTYPVLLDPGGKVNKLFQIEGIPNSFVYDRSGKLVAQSVDMRTRRQFLEMLGRAGLQ